MEIEGGVPVHVRAYDVSHFGMIDYGTVFYDLSISIPYPDEPNEIHVAQISSVVVHWVPDTFQSRTD